MSNLKIGHIELFVSDPLLSARFWRDTLGFRIVAVQEERFVWIDCGGVEVLLRNGSPECNGRRYTDSTHALVLYTSNLQAAAARLATSGVFFEGNDGSSQCLTFRDPDDNWFQIVDTDDHQ